MADATVDQFGDAIDSANDILAAGITDLGTIGIRDGIQALNGYAGVYGNPQALYPPGTVPIYGATPATQPASSNSFFLIILAFLAWKFLR